MKLHVSITALVWFSLIGGIIGGLPFVWISDLQEVIPFHTDLKNMLVAIVMVCIVVGYLLGGEAIARSDSPKRNRCRIGLIFVGPIAIASFIGAGAFIF
ncbi:MAG: hypothetical protein HOG89_02195 [Candidatus Peribacter sp.]|jgi:hypothetical protein|nr:hypothetical protein [Candidatus Peribacter sp.]MBT4392888.1 hypothetical protein [Candidatus Peribacter sp.]MBT4601372.1 hypothetical protein [Candidatus Peribacter sp.]MBT5149376.1 hypothetical protein [Candidatus Peribacter sp.]MBT5637509.1 hypothetical protein [Candidatus Peribacter sp.]